jgi:hypothetical protein
VEEESPKFAGDARYSKGLVRYKDLKDHIKNMQKSKYEREMKARRCKDLAGVAYVSVSCVSSLCVMCVIHLLCMCPVCVLCQVCVKCVSSGSYMHAFTDVCGCVLCLEVACMMCVTCHVCNTWMLLQTSVRYAWRCLGQRQTLPPQVHTCY